MDHLLNTIQHRASQGHNFSPGIPLGTILTLTAALRRELSTVNPDNQPVCLATDHKAIMAAALLLTLTGGPTLILPYALSQRALKQLARTTACQLAITTRPEDLPLELTAIVPHLANDQTKPARLPPAQPEQELVQIFTGGTTGAPQLWSKSGANIFGEAIFLSTTYDINSHDLILATISPTHIYGLLFSVILPLVSGAGVSLASPSFPGEIMEETTNHPLTVLASVPTHFRVLGTRDISGNGLRLAFSSAGMLAPDDNDRFCRHNHLPIIEIYGSTETGGIASRNRWQQEQFFTPFAPVRWQIADQRLLLHSPFISADLPLNDQGLFMASDRVEGKEAGSFALLGRADTITKVGGKRVDLEEIASLIKEQPTVNDCLVMALPDPGGREHLIVALVAGQATDPAILQQDLASKLESYALPRRLKVVRELPRRANGKVDRNKAKKLLQK